MLGTVENIYLVFQKINLHAVIFEFFIKIVFVVVTNC